MVRAYLRWGTDCLHRFNGEYALAIYEAAAHRLFLARDRMGVKSLFYRQEPGELIFASELGQLLDFPGVEGVLDDQGVLELMMLGPGRIPGSGILRDMKALEPGCCAVCQEGRMEVTRYWRLEDRVHRESLADTAAHVRELVTEALRCRLPEDGQVGACLSGGLDSSILSALCARELGPLQTFSVDYLNNDLYFRPGKYQPDSDGDYIRRMSEAIHSIHRPSILTAEDLDEALEPAMEARNFPGMADIDASLLVFGREIRPHVPAALSGECADEIFGGYPWYQDPVLRDSPGFPWSRNLSLRSGLLKRNRREGEALAEECCRKTCREAHILEGVPAIDRRIKELVKLNFYWFMQTLLERNDRMSSRCGLRLLVPFCDWQVAQYAYGIPWAFKNLGGREKGLLRHAFRDLLPPEILARKKSPYPKSFDPAYDLLIREKMEILLKSDSPLWDFLEHSALIDTLCTELDTPWYGQLMRKTQTMGFLIQADCWLRRYRIRLSLQQ